MVPHRLHIFIMAPQYQITEYIQEIPLKWHVIVQIVAKASACWCGIKSSSMTARTIAALCVVLAIEHDQSATHTDLHFRAVAILT